jgi:hypothetical protein
MNVVKLRVPASPAHPLTIRRLLDEIHQFYFRRSVLARHVPQELKDQPPSNINYARLMDGQHLFMGLQWLSQERAYYVHLMRRTAAGVLQVLK